MLIGIHVVLVLSIYCVRHPVNDIVLLWRGHSGISQDLNEIEGETRRETDEEGIRANRETIRDAKRDKVRLRRIVRENKGLFWPCL